MTPREIVVTMPDATPDQKRQHLLIAGRRYEASASFQSAVACYERYLSEGGSIRSERDDSWLLKTLKLANTTSRY